MSIDKIKMGADEVSRRNFLIGGAAFSALVAADHASAEEPPKSRLSTHVLDTYHGAPAGGMKIEFLKLEGDSYGLVKSVTTNVEGRVDEPLLPVPGAAAIGRYQLVFHLADYFKASGVTLPDPPFLDKVVIHFAIYEDKDHYHVPLLCSPWSYSTYRGS
jgi:5-hydroxyisourate hydrolase